MPTDSGAPYALHLPDDTDIADVPADMAAFAADLTAVLNTKMQKTDLTLPGGSVVQGTDTLYQTKIKFVTAVPSSTAGYNEGDVIFVVP